MRRPVRRLPARRLRAEIEATILPTRDAPRPVSAPGAIVFTPSPGWLEPRRRVYAVGDVHGCADQLVALHAAIAEDLARRPVADALLVHLGDYIDWGPDSARVIDILVRQPLEGVRTINLAGDHEQMLLDALDGDRAAATDWLVAGGADALRSWGLDPETPREQWAALLPATHVAFLRGLILSHREGEYFFVHAGIRPGVKLADQARDDLQRMRQPFLYTERDFGVVVVHGHSTTGVATVQANRIGIDTGAGIGGKLTCAVLEEDRVGFLTA
jgi:serine/threonine protein phosphatase 1